MDKANSAQSSFVLAKGKEDGREKIIFHFTPTLAIKSALCFLLQFAAVFTGMAPFGAAFYVSVFKSTGWIVYFLATIVGLVVSHTQASLAYAAALLVVTVLLGVFDSLNTTYYKALITGLLITTVKTVYLILNGFLLYGFFAAVLEGVLCIGSVIVFSESLPVLLNLKHRSFISGREITCVMVFFSVIMLSLSPLPDVYRFSIGGTCSILLIYLLSMEGSANAAVSLGIVLGLIYAMRSGGDSAIVGTYAFGALLAGLMKKYGKMGIVLGFVIANTAASVLLNPTHTILISIYDSLAAAVLFLLMPSKVKSYFTALSVKSSVRASDTENNREPTKNLTALRLEEMSETFRELSAVYARCTGERKLGKTYVASSIHAMCDRVCTGCSRRGTCFRKEEAVAFTSMLSMLDTAFRNGRITTLDIPPELKSVCHRQDSLVNALNAMAELLKTEKQWLSKINESRKLIADQLAGVADAVGKIAQSTKMHLDLQLEETLWAQLDRSGVHPSCITAETDDSDYYRICVSCKESNVKKDTVSLTLRTIEELIGTQPRLASRTCASEEIIFTFCPCESYQASFGYATRPKPGEKVCGDSFDVIKLEDKSVVMALSDGMGSGKEAASESKITIELLEKFLHAGFDSDTAVRLINSSLLLKSARDTFSTVDLCDINLADGGVTFTKLGAANSYIRSGGKIKSVRGSGLPVGIVCNIEIEKHMLSIDSDTLIVMLSDGVADIALKNKEHEGWIERELSRLTTANPQIIAGKLLETALKIGDSQTCDDMTVMTACISKSADKV